MVHQKLVRAARDAEPLTDCLAWLDFLSYRGLTHVLLTNGNLLTFAELLSCESQLASDNQLTDIRTDFHALVQNLSPEYCLGIHFIRRRHSAMIFDTDPAAAPVVHYLRQRQSAFWAQRRGNMYENRVFITLEGRSHGIQDHWLTALLRGWRTFNMDRFREGLDTYHNVWRGILDNMGSFARLRPLDQPDAFRLLYYYLNPLQYPPPETLSYNPAYTIPEQVADANLYDDPHGDLYREDNGAAGPHTYFRVMNLDTLPAISFPTIFDSLARLGSSRPDERISEYWITQYYQPQDPDSFITTLNIKQNFGNSLKNVQFLKNVAQKSIDLADDAAQITNAIQRDKEGVGHFSMFCVAYDRDLSRLEATCNRLLTDVRAKNARFIIESKFARFASFLSSLPGHSGLSTLRLLNYRRATILNANFADFAMIHKDDDGDPDGPVAFETPTGGLLRLDVFSRRATSWNAYIAGTTGAGKSFTMNLILGNMLARRPITYILDVGNSYDPMMQLVPGSVKVTVDFTNPDLKLNPFAFPHPPDHLDRVGLSHLLEHLITGGTKPLDQTARVDIIEAIRPLFEDYHPDTPPVLTDFYKQLELINPDLAKPLRLWLPGGPYEAFFNASTDTFREADVVYFELTGFDDHPDVGSAITYMLFTKIFQRLQRPEDQARKKLIILDECWKFLMNDTMAGKIKELYRTVRKHAGSIWTITQHPNDLINSPHRDAILANTSWLLFLEQKGVGEEAKEAFGLNAREFRVMKEIRMRKGLFSELLIKGPYKRQVRVLADPWSYYTYTTDPDERDRRNRLTSELGSLQQAIDTMAGGGSDAQ